MPVSDGAWPRMAPGRPRTTGTDHLGFEP